jgi:pyrroline-5-carboxylate reductase
MHVVAAQSRYIGKETDRKWDHGADLSLLTFKPAHFDELGKMAKADPALIEQLAAVPVKALARKANVDRNTIRKMLRGSAVRRDIFQRVVLALTEWSPTR